ncbi:tRNA3(Ser)-specific nuclease WapA [Daldinia childiae]|uniref:tRNA3(Ser)-specific nuclease WapA n=1 Tax=Daldinia childiae TaxID=326645 RepID=UPI001447CB14|nr:tRNA3(Ser)-specific nuclease WapA [Daldinia childiae]KAF3064957.1 tRNA3(Ser)-specific nuclease WapA [Daldinia childiae]
MGDAGQYQGSQAFSHIVPQKNESVNPNTGSLNYTTQLLQLRGVRPGIDLSLNVFYSYGTVGTFGLPHNWSLDLPYVLDGKSLTANGHTYAIDYEWSDDKDYASGLKYMNNHGIKFEKIVPPQDLPSGLPGQYGYQLSQVDGSKVYFDVEGKPLQNSDIYGNFIYYSYLQGSDGGVASQNVLLDFVQDSWGQRITFQYQESQQWVITLPTGSYTTINFSEDGILTIQDPAELITSFDYQPSPGDSRSKVLSIITYPTGLSSRYEWGTVEYLDGNGSAQYMPKVDNHYQMDTDDTIYSNTSYDLGGFSGGSTYTGAAIGLKMAGATDALMDGAGRALSYTYDVTKTSNDKDGNGVARTTTYFNNYHLPIRQIKYSLDNKGNFVEAYQTEYEYDIPIDERARTTAYNYPVATTTFNNTNPTGDPVWQCLTHSSSAYNEYGNLTSRISEVNISGSGRVKQTTTTNEYMTTSCNIQLVSVSTQRDEITQSEEQTANTATEDGRAVASTTSSFLSGAGQQLKPWTRHTYGYDSQGRTITDTLAWAPGASVPDGSVDTVTNTMTYSFDSGTLTQTVYDADKNATVVKYDMRKYAGPMISKTLPLGQTEKFDYDNICRLIKHTDALGYVTTNTYTVGPKGGSESVKSPGGYVKLTKYDVLGRESEVLDNGDPTQATSSEATRLLRRQTYDFLSQVKETTDNLGLVTKYVYDALSRPRSVTDPKKNVLNYQYDDVNLVITQDLNGDIRSVTQLNGRTEALKVVTYPDSSDELATYILETNTVYDGNKRPISTTQIQRPKSSGDSITLEKADIEYGPQSLVFSRTIIGSAVGGTDIVKRQFTYDLLGNTYTWIKDTTYADGREYQVRGPINIYDWNNRLAMTKNQLGQEELNYYDANGWLSKTVRYDGSEVNSICDDVGQFIKTTYPSSSIEVDYDSDGHITQVKDGDDIIKYGITLDGTLDKTTYSDGLTQVNILDKYSRLVTQTDVFGVSRTTEYDRTIAYDGLGQVTFDSRPSAGLGDTTYTYDGNSNILSTTVDGNTTTMSYNEIDQRTDAGFVYDTLGRLATDNQDQKYQFDDRDRLLSVQTGGMASGFEYRADDYLARRKGVSDTVEMYYNSGKVNSLAVLKENKSTEKTSFFTGSKAIVASYTDEKTPDYFFDSVNSTALLVGDDHETSITYDAYGKASPSSTVDSRSNFGFGQEFCDETSGLVYLRSRYYSPKIMGFISMDRNHQENRYAYCEGDPINNFDPLGQSWETALGITALVVGAVIGAVVTAGVGLALEASLGAAVGAFGLSEVAAATASSVIGVASAAIGGAVGNVAGGYVSAAIQGNTYTGMDALVDALTGAAGGSVGKLIEPTAKAFAASARYGERALTPLAQKALANGISGAVNNGTQSIVRPILLGEPISPLKVGTSMLMGFGVGITKTYALEKVKVQYRETSPRVRAAARQFLGRVRGKIQAGKMKDIDIYDSSGVDLVGFKSLSGSSSAVDAEVSTLASSALRSRLGTLSQEHEDLPPLITEL